MQLLFYITHFYVSVIAPPSVSVVGSVSAIGVVGSGGDMQSVASGPTTSVTPSVSDHSMLRVSMQCQF